LKAATASAVTNYLHPVAEELKTVLDSGVA